MLKLIGFPVSNYVNMVEFALLEKGIPYEYVLTYPDHSEAFLAKSPRGKAPALETPRGYLAEASVIMEYLEDIGQGKPLLPADPFERARVRELIKQIELYIELPARSCFGEAFFGGTVPDAIKAKAKDELVAGFAAIKRQAKFAPYVAGADMTLADIMFYFSADMAASVAQRLFGLPLLDELPGARSLLDKLGENPHLQKIKAARDAGLPAFVAGMQAKMGSKR
ncbi:MAG TPA: glutathione S-transferase [Burkholderiaceae bacterium]